MTSANAASVAIFHERSVLLIRRARHPFKDHWTLPGGRVEPGETPQDCALREIGEELGLVLATLLPVSVFAAAPGYRLAVFAARLPEGASPHASAEIADWRWAGLDDPLPQPATPGLADVLRRARTLAV